MMIVCSNMNKSLYFQILNYLKNMIMQLQVWRLIRLDRVLSYILERYNIKKNAFSKIRT